MEANELSRLIMDLIADKKGEDIVLMDLQQVSLIADYFVIGNASSERLINAIADHLREEVENQSQRAPLHIEGRGDCGWVLMDYGDVLVHLFSPEVRSYYDLEGLWADAPILVKMQ